MSPEEGSAATAAVAPIATVAPLNAPRASALQHNNAAPAICANCAAPVAGRFCAECGQRLEHSVHSVWHFIREATEDLTHADSRAWKTFAAQLFKPGFLTREFLEGRRARYLPPLRLYLVLSVVFFLIASATTHQNSAALASLAPEATEQAAAGQAATQPKEDASSCRTNYDGPWREQFRNLLERGCRKLKQDQGRSLGTAFLHNLPRAMFIFLPLLALVMAAMYWRPRRFYVEHLLFFVHNHAFVFLLFSSFWVISLIVPDGFFELLIPVVSLYIPYYLYASMRRVYGQGRWLTLTKLTALSCGYFVFGMLMLALILAYSVLTVLTD
jgi:hypothetical protein